MKKLTALLVIAVSLAACKKGASGEPRGAAAKEMLEAFVKPGADTTALTVKLRPQPADYDAVFTGEAAKQAKEAYDIAWDAGNIVVHPTAEQTEIHVAGTTPEQLKKGEGNASACPTGYKEIADKLKPDMVLYCFRFVKPGEKGGHGADGLVWVNEHWALFPKPFRALGYAPAPAGSGSAAPANSAAQ
jgi:hypothetical protein